MAVVINTITNSEKLSLINNNFTKLAAAINQSLVWRNGDTAGETAFTRDLDMNGYQILNAYVGTHSLTDMVDIAYGASEAAAAAAASAIAASASAASALSSQASAAASAESAAQSAEVATQATTFTQPSYTETSRTYLEKMRDIVSVKDFGAVGDGTLHTVSEQFSSLAEAQSAFPAVTDVALTDSLDAVAIQQADSYSATSGKTLYFPSGVYVVDRTLIRKSNWEGSGRTNAWSYDGRGTVLLAYGSGQPSLWTDVDGTDSSTYTPLVVTARSGLSIQKMTVRCTTAAGRWSCGLFYPSVRRQTLRDVDVMGVWTDAGVRIDASWGSTNTTLTSVHPTVESDVGCNEYSIDNCFLTGLRGLRIQGTTRASTTTPWVWAPGGTSDINIANCRIGIDGTDAEKLASGAGFWHDAVIPNTAGAGQGINFINSTIRVSGKYVLYLDHSARIQMVNTYAETISSWVSAYGSAINSCTSNTSAVTLINDTNGQAWYKDGVAAGSSSLNDWALTRIVSKIRGDGRIATPNIYASASSSDPLKLVSNSGTVGLYTDDGSSQTQFMLLGSSGVRPTTAGGINLGTTSFPFGNIVGQSTRATVSFLPQTDNTVPIGTSSLRITNSFVIKRSWTATVFDGFGTGSPEGVLTAGIGSTYRRTDGGTSTTFYVKESGTGNTGWIAK